MRANSQPLINQLTGPKEVGLRATFRKTLPQFILYNKTDSLGLSNTAWMDACPYGTGVARVTNVGNYLYIQNITDINAAWPAWINTGHPLYPGSRPSIDNGYVHFQSSNTNIYRFPFPDHQNYTLIRSMPSACHLIGINDRVYALWQRNTGAYEIVTLNNQESAHYTIYGLTSMPRVDGVSFNGKEYFYTTDRSAGRIIEIQHAGNGVAGKDSYGVGKPIVPIDAIDEVYGLKMGYASVIDSKVVVTGRWTRTSDDAPITADVYAAGPEYFSFGREMFIGNYEINQKMMRVGNEFVICGATYMYKAKATTVFGGSSHPDLELVTSDFSSISLSEAESRSTNLDIGMSPSLSHTAIATGSDIELEMAYNNNWCKLSTLNLEADRTQIDEQGTSRVVSGVGKTAKRLAQWSPDQGIYIPSQAKMHCYPGQMTKVIRASGRWESTDPEDESAAIRLNDLNKVGVLYSTNRASRGGAMRGYFYYPSDPYLTPYYGVVVNYYRESAAEAAARLGVEVDELTDDMYGHNGILARYSPLDHNGGPGVALWLWRDNAYTKLTSVSLSIPANTWHWLQIEFIEGEIRVKYRLYNSAQWTDLITYVYNSTTPPWKRETLGRGAIYVYNGTPQATYYGFGGTDDTIAVSSHTSFPASGTILVDNERLTYTGKSTATSPSQAYAFSISTPVEYDVDGNFSGNRVTCGRSGWQIAAPHTSSLLLTGADNAYVGLAAAFLHTGPQDQAYRGGRTFRVIGYDSLVPRYWHINDGVGSNGWSYKKGNTAYGYWGPAGENTIARHFYFSEDVAQLFGITDNIGADSVAAFTLQPALYLNAVERQSSGKAVAHTGGTLALYTANSVLCAYAASFTQEEDQSMEDALKTIVNLSGGKMSCRAESSTTFTSTAPNLFNVYLNKPNFIASFDLPSLVDGGGAGIAFRTSGGFTVQSGRPYAANGYYLEMERAGSLYYLTLYRTNTWTILERVPFRHATTGEPNATVPAGTIKVSVQDGFFSVWLNGRYVFTFYDEQYQTGNTIAFVHRQTANSSYPVYVSELNELLADIVVGVRGNGMSVLSELLADRHIHWRDNPDGSMHFYRQRWYATGVPDIISSVMRSKTDSRITRVRAEGAKIAEVAGAMSLGNTFATINARHANTIDEVREEAEFILNESYYEANQRQYGMDVHPGVQPGDLVEFTEGVNQWFGAAIRSQSITIGFSGNNFVCDMQCDCIEAEI